MYKVFYIEDNEDNRKLMERFLRFEGFEVICVGTGQEGIDRAEEIMPDVFLIDVNLPDISGYEVMEALNARPRTQPIPKVAFSAGGIQTGRDIFTQGPNFFMEKPSNIELVIEKLRYVIEDANGQGAIFTYSNQKRLDCHLTY